MNYKNTFYFTNQIIKRSRMYGTQVRECKVYQIREDDGYPLQLGIFTYNTGSTPGAVNEVFMWLREHNFIETQYTGYYFFDSDVYKTHKIHELQ